MTQEQHTFVSSIWYELAPAVASLFESSSNDAINRKNEQIESKTLNIYQWKCIDTKLTAKRIDDLQLILDLTLKGLCKAVSTDVLSLFHL